MNVPQASVILQPNQMLIPIIIFLAFGVFLVWIYVIKGDEVTEFNADKGYKYTVPEGNRTKDLIYLEKDKRDILKMNKKNSLPPLMWKVERFYHRLLGIFVGLASLWILTVERLKLFSGKPNFGNLNWPDFMLLLIAFVGINDRLPTIAHSIQDWLKRS